MGTDLYAGGWFTTAGGVSANRIAKWNGTTWSSLGSGMNSDVFSLAVMGTDLYAGGDFTMAGGVSASHIAKWNGTTWSALGSGINSFFSDVNSLAVIGTDLYAGGNFTMVGGVSSNRIAKWNGTTWSSLGSGLNDDVNSLAVIGTDLYAGGIFDTAGGNPSHYIARWHDDSLITGIIENPAYIPDKYSLYQNYPNPFNPTTSFAYDIPKGEFVKIAVYDIAGREVRILENNYKSAGRYIVNFDGSNISSGVYFYSVQAGNYRNIKKMVLIK